MQKFIIIMILLFILCCGLTTIIDKNENTSLIKGFALKEVIANNDTENVVNNNIIKGLTLVTDERFKTELIRFLKLTIPLAQVSKRLDSKHLFG